LAKISQGAIMTLKKTMLICLAVAGGLFAAKPSGKYKADKADKNCPPLYSEVEFKPDGTWAAQYGVGGTWKMKGNQLTIKNNGVNQDHPAKITGGKIMMPTPADPKKTCTLKK
jgi:hypothetical protein